MATRVEWAPDAVRRLCGELERQLPGVLAWYGRETGSWWAFVPLTSGDRLVEAVSPRDLREAIVRALARA
ncbi:hypothetical protein [Actinomadura sp. WAC 06369]|uniref:hypothetical protein n=1 Tax=Actinomadura sp. WAC 06369 TaxID=2203193 RepID=UPI000F7855A6|nr:hypothetical protein [Actinomadura sp. WAC 06369]RSN59571.1 hypothetical protein DMH08_22645 [Actinomadura sp. WAC 06369]